MKTSLGSKGPAQFSNATIRESEFSLLIVDDEPLICEILNYIFQGKGFRVACAMSGNEAFELLKFQKFDAVISDVDMPNGNGIQLIERISAFSGKKPEIFLISGQHESLDLMGKPPFAFFRKPVDFEAFALIVCEKLKHPGRRPV